MIWHRYLKSFLKYDQYLPTYSTQSISLLLMSWRRKEPGNQQPWYWPSKTEITRPPHVKGWWTLCVVLHIPYRNTSVNLIRVWWQSLEFCVRLGCWITGYGEPLLWSCMNANRRSTGCIARTLMYFQVMSCSDWGLIVASYNYVW